MDSTECTKCRRSEVAQSCPTLCDPMDCGLPGSSHGIFQARVLEWVPFPSPGDLPHPEIKPASLKSPALAGRFFATSATWEAHVLNGGYVNKTLKLVFHSSQHHQDLKFVFEKVGDTLVFRQQRGTVWVSPSQYPHVPGSDTQRLGPGVQPG